MHILRSSNQIKIPQANAIKNSMIKAMMGNMMQAMMMLASGSDIAQFAAALRGKRM